MKVFILGAGASRGSDSRLPVMKGFFDESLDKDDPIGSSAKKSHSESVPFQFDLLRKFIDWHFASLEEGKPLKASTDRSKINVEEVFIHLEFLIAETSLDNPLKGELLAVRSQLLQYVSRRLRFTEKVETTKYSKLLELVDPTDSIVCFNWDILFDIALDHEKFNRYIWNQAALFRPQGCGDSEQPGYLLKMHGSLHWYFCTNTDCHRHGVILRDRLPGATGQIDISFDHIPKVKGWPRCPQCREALRQAIVPPAAGKIDLMPPPIRAQWKIAYQVLQEASEWIFIGYSIPTLDVEASSLFRSAARSYCRTLKADPAYVGKKICIADLKADDVEEKIRKLVPPQVCTIVKRKHFDDFLENVKS